MSIQSISTSLPPQSNAQASAVAREIKAAAPPAQEKAQPDQHASAEQVKAAIKSVREYIEPTNNALEFSINNDTGQLVVKVIDSSTKEVIRQIPSEEMIAIAKTLDSIKGLFVKQNA